MTIRRLGAMVAAALLTLLCSCSSRPETPAFEPGTLTVTFSFTRQSGYSSNQFAVWIENMDGSLIKTLYATRFTANGGYKNRPEAIPLWVEKSALESMAKPDIDAITGATPGTGALAYVWDLTDAGGGAVSPGMYRFLVEGSTRGRNRVVCSGVIHVDHASATVEASVEFLPEASPDYPALSADADENSMIGTVTARFVPAKE